MSRTDADVVAGRRQQPGGGRQLSLWWVPAVAAVALQVWGVYRPSPPPTDPRLPWFDKAAHLISFGLPVLLLTLAIVRSAGTAAYGRMLALVTALFALHAVLSELIQGAFYRQRSGDLFDVLADLAGVASGAAVAWLVLRRGRNR